MKKLIHPRRSNHLAVAKAQHRLDPCSLATASRQFLIGNETSSHFRVSHRKQSLGPISNREEFSLIYSQFPIQVPQFSPALSHHRSLCFSNPRSAIMASPARRSLRGRRPMATQTRTRTVKFDAARFHGLDRESLIRLYRTMFLSRRLDDREIQLKRQNKIFFQISGAGHEAATAAAGLVLKPAYDWFYLYYRDRALCLMLGVTPYEMLLQGVGAKDDPSSAGRQMPSHWGHQALNLVSKSSPTGTQWLQAVGAAEASLYYDRFPKALAKAQAASLGAAVRHQRDEVVCVSGGEGATSEGEFWEALNTASNRKLPVVFFVENNAYAISVPIEVQTPGGSISRLVANFPGL